MEQNLEMNEAEQRFKSLGSETHRINFPILFWEEFSKECEESYNNTYWMKIKSDHDFKTQMAPITNLVITEMNRLSDRVEELELKLEELSICITQQEKSPNTSPETPKTGRKTMGKE